MKKIRSFLAILAMSSLLIAPIACAPGCASANKVAYQTVTAANISAETAIALYETYVHQQALAGKPVAKSTNDKVVIALEKYKAAALLVVDAGASYTAVVGTEKQTTAQASLNTAIMFASTYLGDLINLLKAIGVKI